MCFNHYWQFKEDVEKMQMATQHCDAIKCIFFFIKKTALPECRIFLRVLILILPVLALVEMRLDSKGGPQLERADITMLITVTNRNQKWQMKCAYECVELYSLWKVEAVFIHVHVWVIIYYFVQTVYQACAYHEINFTTLKCSRCECRWSHSQHGCWTVLMTIRLLPCFTPSPSKKTPYCDVIYCFSGWESGSIHVRLIIVRSIKKLQAHSDWEGRSFSYLK